MYAYIYHFWRSLILPEDIWYHFFLAERTSFSIPYKAGNKSYLKNVSIHEGLFCCIYRSRLTFLFFSFSI